MHADSLRSANDHQGGAVRLHVFSRHEKGETSDASSSHPARGWGATVL